MSVPRHRVAITGFGLITCLGGNADSTWHALEAGKSGIGKLSLFDTSDCRCQTGGEIKSLDLPPTKLTVKQQRRLDRATRMLLLAAEEALDRAKFQPSDLPTILGTTGGGMHAGEIYHRALLERNGAKPSLLMQYTPQRQPFDLQIAFGYRGPLLVFANACASSANAIGYAFQLVRSGQADRVLTGGYDALAKVIFVGFDSLQASTPERCRPFDKNRSGLAISEGAGVLLVESFDAARARGADVLGEVAGYGQSVDTNHMTQPHPDGDGATRAMTDAIADAGLSPSDIDYINAHGTATPQNDRMESKAIHRVFGTRAVPVSSTKGAVGHSLGGAGGIEAVICALALQHQKLPTNVNYETPDPDCNLAVVRESTPAKLRSVLSNNFGFGGLNASLVFRAP